MITWFRSLLPKPLHAHLWEDTRVNGWYIATEQRCKCGAARHLWDFKDVMPIDKPPNWRDGKHPMSKDVEPRTQPAGEGEK